MTRTVYGSNDNSNSVERGDGGVGGSNNSSEMMSVLVLGKAGNGKSSLCNAVLGEERFAVGRGLSATTVTAQSETAVRGHRRVQVVDTPDVTNCGMDAQRRKEEVDKWRQLTLPFLTLVLLAVRCDVRYTAEEFAIYREIINLWGDNSLKKRLVVAFTFGDRQDNDLEDELRTVCPELKSVLSDAGNQYVLFDKTNEESRNRILQDIQSAIQKKSGASRGTSTDRLCVHPTAPKRRWLLASWHEVTLILAALDVILFIFTITFAINSETFVVVGCGVPASLLLVFVVVLVVKGKLEKS